MYLSQYYPFFCIIWINIFPCWSHFLKGFNNYFYEITHEKICLFIMIIRTFPGERHADHFPSPSCLLQQWPNWVSGPKICAMFWNVCKTILFYYFRLTKFSFDVTGTWIFQDFSTSYFQEILIFSLILCSFMLKKILRKLKKMPSQNLKNFI